MAKVDNKQEMADRAAEMYSMYLDALDGDEGTGSAAGAEGKSEGGFTAEEKKTLAALIKARIGPKDTLDSHESIESLNIPLIAQAKRRAETRAMLMWAVEEEWRDLDPAVQAALLGEGKDVQKYLKHFVDTHWQRVNQKCCSGQKSDGNRLLEDLVRAYVAAEFESPDQKERRETINRVYAAMQDPSGKAADPKEDKDPAQLKLIGIAYDQDPAKIKAALAETDPDRRFAALRQLLPTIADPILEKRLEGMLAASVGKYARRYEKTIGEGDIQNLIKDPKVLERCFNSETGKFDDAAIEELAENFVKAWDEARTEGEQLGFAKDLLSNVKEGMQPLIEGAKKLLDIDTSKIKAADGRADTENGELEKLAAATTRKTTENSVFETPKFKASPDAKGFGRVDYKPSEGTGQMAGLTDRIKSKGRNRSRSEKLPDGLAHWEAGRGYRGRDGWPV